MRSLAPAALLFAAAYHYAYVAYLNPTFEYANYLYTSPGTFSILLTYCLVLAPLLLYWRSRAPGTFGASLVYVLGYVPGVLTLLFCWQRGIWELLAVQASLAASMACIFAVAGAGAGPDRQFFSLRGLSVVVQALTILSVALLVIVYRDYMRLVSFAEVYDLRFETADVEAPLLTGYLISWLTYCFLPFLVASALLRRSASSIAWALLASVLIYAATGAKSALLLPFIVVGLYLLMGRKGTFDVLTRLLWGLGAGVFGVVLLLPDEGAWVWVKSLLLLRTLGTGGWVLSTYYEYFTRNGYTFYTHIGPVNAVTHAYPYGDLSLGQLIGRAYVGSDDANFNANFWASDGFAALGIPGIAVVTVVVCGVLFMINRVSNGFSSRFVALWMTGFWFALMNMPLTTALLSGGGLLSVFFMWAARLRWRIPRADAGIPRTGGGVEIQA